MTVFSINRGSEQKTKQCFPTQYQALGRPPIVQNATPVPKERWYCFVLRSQGSQPEFCTETTS